MAASPAQAITGNVESTAQAIQLSGLVNTSTTRFDFPTTSGANNVASVNVPGLLGTGVITDTVNGNDLADTSTATSQVNGLTVSALGASLLGTVAVTGQCNGTGAGVTGSTQIVQTGGLVTLPSNPAPNGGPIDVSVGTVAVAKVWTNIQTGGNTNTVGGTHALTVKALRVQVLGIPGVLDAADITVGQVSCTTTKPATPAVSTVAPTSGPLAGGTTVTLNGTGMLGVTGVTFGGVAGTNLTRVSTTQVTVDTPAHAAGPVDVAVTNATGTGTAGQQFTYRAVPTVTAVSPSAGPLVGGTPITITGTGFADVTGVSVGGTPATGVIVDSPTQIRATTGARAAGAVHVTVTGTGGTSATSSADVYSYLTAPTLTSVAPTSGSTQGGDTLTLTGTNFTPDASVKVGTTQVTPTYVNSTTLTITSPAHAAGPTDIVVQTAGGPTAPVSYNYLVYPVVTSYSPHFGFILSGGETVTVTGTGLDNVTGVRVDVVDQSSTIANQTATSLQFTTPGLGLGAYPVYLIGPNGVQTYIGDFTYATLANPGVAPTITSLNPTHGVAGTEVTLTGTDFTNTSRVFFGGTPATSVIRVSSTQVKAVVPAGLGVVGVTADDGGSNVSAPSAFTYDPVLTSISPTRVASDGTGTLTLNGSGFTPATVIYIDNTPYTPDTQTSTKLTVNVPVHAIGNATVTARLNGVASAGRTLTFVPVIATLTPATGSAAGGDVVTVNGSGFDNTTVVLVDGTPVTTTYVNGTELRFTLPAHAAGNANVTVRTGTTTSDPVQVTYTAVVTPSPTPSASPSATPTASPSETPTASPTPTAGPTTSSPTTSPTSGTGTGGGPDGGTGTDGSPDQGAGGGGTGGTGGGGTSTTGGSTGSGTGSTGTTGGISSSSKSAGSGSGSTGSGSASATAKATPKASAGKTAEQSSGGGVTDDALTSALTGGKAKWLGLLAALAALGAAFWLGDGWMRQWQARRLADRLVRYWGGVGPAVKSDAVAVIKVPSLGDDWRWPVYPVAAGAAAGDRGYTRGVGLQAGHLDAAGHENAAGDLAFAALAADRYDPLLDLHKVAPGEEVHLITPERTLTYQVSRTAAFGNYIAGWSPIEGRPPAPGSSLTLATTDAGDDKALAPNPASLKASLERISPTTADGRPAPQESEAPA